MATPFSPFVGKRPKPLINRRQSQLPSDLIDWDAPEIPELEKQRIIYEDYIKELKEENDIDLLLSEQTFIIAHNTIVQEYLNKLKKLEDETSKEMTKERNRVNLLLGQLKMFEENLKESNQRADDLEGAANTYRQTIADLENDKKVLIEEKSNCETEIAALKEEQVNYLSEIENLNFKNNETACELEEALKMVREKRNEALEYKKLWQALKERRSHYMKAAANENDREN